MIKVYTQTTADTCLPSCLLMVLEKKGLVKPAQDLEIEILVEGGKLDKDNRAFAHLAYVCNKFDLEAFYFSNDDTAISHAQAVKEKLGIERISCEKLEIDTDLIERSLSKGYVILCINDYGLRQEVHFPHYVVIEKYENGKFVVLDPWDGKTFVLERNILDEAIKLLDKIHYWRELIVIK